MFITTMAWRKGWKSVPYLGHTKTLFRLCRYIVDKCFGIYYTHFAARHFSFQSYAIFGASQLMYFSVAFVIYSTVVLPIVISTHGNRDPTLGSTETLNVSLCVTSLPNLRRGKGQTRLNDIMHKRVANAAMTIIKVTGTQAPPIPFRNRFTELWSKMHCSVRVFSFTPIHT